MNTQLSSSVWIPRFYPLNAGYTIQNPLSAPGEQVVHTAVLPPQSVLLTTSGNHVLVQAPQQILPLVASDPSLQVQSCLDPVSNNLLIHTPTVRQVVSKSTKHKHATRHNIDDHNSSVNRVQKKKKVSPSAKRRSRLRLKAFLEAKKSAAITEEESSVEKSEKLEPTQCQNVGEGAGIQLENTNDSSNEEKTKPSSPSSPSSTAGEESNVHERGEELTEKIAS